MPRGGIRIGAGRPKGQGKFGEKTKPIRIPLSMVDNVLSFIKNNDLVFIGGPCAIETRDHTFFMVDKIQKICSKLKINFIWSNKSRNIFSTNFQYL